MMIPPVLIILAASALAQPGRMETREIARPPEHGEPVLREDFERCEPAGAVLLDERKPDTWVLRTKDWPNPLLNAVDDAPDLTYDPQLTGVYDIYLGTRATHFTVSVGLKLASEPDFTIITSPRGTERVHYDWEFCFRREAPMDGEKIVIHPLGQAVYIDYLKFVPVITGKTQARIATDHVMIAQEAGKHFAFPGVARLTDGSLYWCGITTRLGINHVQIATSSDLGRTWATDITTAMSLPYHQPWLKAFWDEPVALPLDPERWLCLYRVDMDGYLYQNQFTDAGKTFSTPQKTKMWGCPPYLLKLQDGRLLALYGHRRPPWGIRACVSTDEGATWDTDREMILRDDAGHGDLGYPTAIEIEPGLVFAVCYFNHAGPECTIEGTFFRP